MTVITISRQYGSGGDEIAGRVCDLLGYQMFDKDMICQAAAETGLSEQEVIDYSEENYKVSNFLDRLLNRSRPVIHSRVWTEDDAGSRCAEVALSEEGVLALVQKAIRSAYRAGNMVIVGRGGMLVLRDLPGVLHVRVEAPIENRIQHVKQATRQCKQSYFADIELRREAQDQITGRDESSAAYIRQFYNEDWGNPLLYHLVLNTAAVSTEQAARMIARVASEFEVPKSAEPMQ